MSTSGSAPGNNRIRVLVALAILAGAIILLASVEWASIVPGAKPTGDTDKPAESGAIATPAAEMSGGQTTIAVRDPDPGPTPHRAFAATLFSPPAPPEDAGVSPLADKLNNPESTVRNDLEIVDTIISNYLQAFHEIPIGSNAEITAALAGDNSRGHAPLAPDSKAINEYGELVDRWGTPFFFHQMSSTSMEVRSAGPDRMLYTSDDAVWANGAFVDPAVAVAGAEAN